MNRTAIIVIGVVLAIAVGIVVIWLVAMSPKPSSETVTTPSSSSQLQESTSDELPLEPSSGATDSLVANVTIQGNSFAPASLTVKKGTTVTWTNKDGTNHGVVSDSDAPAGGPPKTASSFGDNEEFSFTYDTVGTFRYHCSIHSFMHGTIEVVE